MKHDAPAQIVLGMAVPIPDGRGAARFVEGVLFCDVDADGASPAAAAMARDIADSVAPQGGVYRGGLQFLQGTPPESEFVHLWRVTVGLVPTSPTSARMEADYWCRPGCPSEQVALMWRFFGALKGVGIPARRTGRRGRDNRVGVTGRGGRRR